MRLECDGWHMHTGVADGEQRRRLLRFMWRRSWWAARHHGWRATIGKITMAGFCWGGVVSAVANWPSITDALAGALLAALVMALVVYPASLGGAQWLRSRRMTRGGRGWVPASD